MFDRTTHSVGSLTVRLGSASTRISIERPSARQNFFIRLARRWAPPKLKESRAIGDLRAIRPGGLHKVHAENFGLVTERFTGTTTTSVSAKHTVVPHDRFALNEGGHRRGIFRLVLTVGVEPRQTRYVEAHKRRGGQDRDGAQTSEEFSACRLHGVAFYSKKRAAGYL